MTKKLAPKSTLKRGLDRKGGGVLWLDGKARRLACKMVWSFAVYSPLFSFHLFELKPVDFMNTSWGKKRKV